MSTAETLYHQIADSLPDGKKSKMFGCPCIKAPNGKAAFIYWPKEDVLVFKLHGEAQQEALSLDGAHVFQPMAERPPMNGWIQIPAHYASRWPEWARASLDYVKTL